jgi:translation initiation factor 4E
MRFLLIVAPCSLYNNIKTPGQLQPSATFYLFKEGIEPKWEDPKNFNGGSWTANVPNRSKPLLDAWWLNTVRACMAASLSCWVPSRPPGLPALLLPGEDSTSP